MMTVVDRVHNVHSALILLIKYASAVPRASLPILSMWPYNSISHIQDYL
jgi:hypothetical protein